MCIFIMSRTFVCIISYSKRNWERYQKPVLDQKYIYTYLRLYTTIFHNSEKLQLTIQCVATCFGCSCSHFQASLKRLYWTRTNYSCQILIKNLNFLDKISKYTQISNFMKLHLVGGELFHAVGQTDMMKLQAILGRRLSIRIQFCLYSCLDSNPGS